MSRRWRNREADSEAQQGDHVKTGALEVAVEASRKALEDFRNECLAEAPVKVGDVIKVNGYSHDGKKMLVERVHLAGNLVRGTTRWVAVGPVLKKDGSVGVQRAESFWDIEEGE